ncbi:prion-like protein [Aphelenchoides avenae]|nr:prion-like protein [Aphelenchus avenae]
MCTDPLPNVRSRIEQLIKDIDSKYAGMVLSKAIPGVRLAFRLQKQLADPSRPVRGIRARENATAAQLDRSGMPKTINDAEAVLRGLYTSYRSNRQQRRNFLASVLRQFAESAREKLAIDEWIFVADNLAHFPYQVLDEPLYVIHTADGIISVAGQNILNAVREIIYPGKLAPDPDDEVSDLTTDKIYSNMPEDKSQLYALKHDSQACYILLCLKQYLMRAYGFKEDKLKEYGPSEGVKAYDKPLSRRAVGVFTPEFALRELRADDQRDTLEGHIKLAEHFDAFNRMFMQLDTEEDEKEDVPVTTNAVPDEDPDVVEGDEGVSQEDE